MKKIKIAAVSYLNTKPFLYGLEQSGMLDEVELHLDIPAVCAQKLINGTVDMGLVPVAVIPQVPHAEIVSDFCIGANGNVRTVAIFSEVPIEKTATLYLDYQSRTSVRLAQYLLKNYWKIQPELLAGQQGFEQKIGGTTAGVVIGDRAIELENQFEYVYDLSHYWALQTGLPFVFAAWVSRLPLDKNWLARFNEALRLGVDNAPTVAKAHQAEYPHFSVMEYYAQNIDFVLDTNKKKALYFFLEVIQQ